MKYAILSDIHGNLPALRLAMEDAQQNGAEEYWFVGDYCTRAPWFNDVVALLRQLPNARIICGNEETYLHLADRGDGQFSVTYWTAEHIRPDHLAWLDALPARMDFSLQDTAVHIAHNSEAFLGKAEMTFFPPWRLLQRYPNGPVEREQLLKDVRQHLLHGYGPVIESLEDGIYIFGHTHCQWHAQFGKRWLINPGSCGIPLDSTRFGARYTLLTLEGGEIGVEERCVPYDAESLIAQAKQQEQYPATRVWSELIFDEWRTCRDHIMRFLWYTEDYARRIGDPRRPFAWDTWDASYEAWVRDGKPLLPPET